MDIEFQSALASFADMESARPISSASPNGVTPLIGGAVDGPSVMPVSEAFPRADSSEIGIIGIIDKVRADFETFRSKLVRQEDPQVISQNPRDAIQHLSDSMDRAVRTQVDILELGVTLNAGLTAAQQSQNSVKTLLEKS